MFLAFMNCGGVLGNRESSLSDSDSANTHRPYRFFFSFTCPFYIFENKCTNNEATDVSHCFQGDSVKAHGYFGYECDSGES